MKVSIACDRAGIQLKNFIIENLKSEFEFIDFGTN
jgi:ribose 5-phosphate isomerase RpiB